MADPSISCIIPVYNGERYLAEAIDSVLGQTLPPSEIIVVDDGSTDGTARILAQYEGRIRSAYQENADTAAARNHGIRLSRGDFLAFLDADDYFHPEKLERQMARFASRPELDLCLCGVQSFRSPDLDSEPNIEMAAESATSSQQVIGWLMRRQVFDRFGPFSEDPRFGFCESSELFLRLRHSGVLMETLPEALVFRRLHDDNKTRDVKRHRDAIVELYKQQADLRRRASSADARRDPP